MSTAPKLSYSDEAYIVRVGVEDRSKGPQPDDQRDHLQVSVTWNVKRSYYSEIDDDKRWPIRDHNERHVFDGMLIPSFESEYSLQKLIDTMTFEHMIYEKIPFSFLGCRLRWIDRCSGSASTADEPLTSVFDMIQKICDVLNGMVLAGRKKLDVLVTFDKQITLSPHQYAAVERKTLGGVFY